MSGDAEKKEGKYNFTIIEFIGAAGAMLVGWGTNMKSGVGVWLLFMATVNAIVQGLTIEEGSVDPSLASDFNTATTVSIRLALWNQEDRK
jgi:hypothetical protein